MVAIYIIEETIRHINDELIEANYIFYDRKWMEDRITINKDKLKQGKRIKKFGMACIKLDRMEG